jgi:hypothetical protein
MKTKKGILSTRVTCCTDHSFYFTSNSKLCKYIPFLQCAKDRSENSMFCWFRPVSFPHHTSDSDCPPATCFDTVIADNRINFTINETLSKQSNTVTARRPLFLQKSPMQSRPCLQLSTSREASSLSVRTPFLHVFATQCFIP